MDEKVLQVIEKSIAQIWDCKFEIDKVHLIIYRLYGMAPNDLLRKHQDDMHDISREDMELTKKALKENNNGRERSV